MRVWRCKGILTSVMVAMVARMSLDEVASLDSYRSAEDDADDEADEARWTAGGG